MEVIKSRKYLIPVVFVLIIIAIILIIKFGINKKEEEIFLNKKIEFNYFTVSTNDKFGVINLKGELVVPAKYENIIIPNPSKAIFFCYDENNAVKILNEKSEELFKSFEFVFAIPLVESLSKVPYEKEVLKFRQDNKYGLINLKGEILLEAKFDELFSVANREGRFLAKQNDKYGVIDTQGNVIIKFEYDDIIGDGYIKEDSSNIESGYITTIKTNEGYRYGYIDYNRKKIIENEFNDLYRINEIKDSKNIYIIAAKNGKFGIIKNKDVILDFQYSEINYIDEYFVAIKNDTDIKIDINGKEIQDGQAEQNKLEEKYQYVEYIGGDKYIVILNEILGLVDGNDTNIIEIKYDSMEKIKNTNIVVGILLETGITDIYNSEFKKSLSMKDAKLNLEENYIKIFSNEEVEYVNFDGKQITNKEIFTNNQLISFKKDNKWGFLDKNKNIKIENIYDMVTELNIYGFAGIKKGNLWGVIDENANIIQETIYEFENENTQPDFIGKFYKVDNGLR